MKRCRLPVPDFFDSDRVGEIYRVPYQQRASEAREWAGKHSIGPASKDSERLCLMIIDVQNTFCIPGFELFIGGRSGRAAVDDNIRLCEFIYHNLGVLTSITATMDSHKAFQIFHPAFLIDERGNPPEPATIISVEDVEMGRWAVNPSIAESIEGGDRDRLQRHLLHYTRKLREKGKYQLMIWPYHAMLGGIGHSLVPAVEEALFFHSMARSCQVNFELKGDSPLSENYSVLHPEVLDDADGSPIARVNDRLMRNLLEYDAVIIAGQAKSHCVAWTIDDLLGEISKRDLSLAQKIYLLEDCTSPVVIPGVADFTDEADAAFGRFAQSGMHIIKSRDS